MGNILVGMQSKLQAGMVGFLGLNMGLQEMQAM
jgi:hypothetical protein